MGLISETDWRSSSCMKELARLKELQVSYHEYLDVKRRYDALNPVVRLFSAEPRCPLGDKETCLGQMRDYADMFCKLFNVEHGLLALETPSNRESLSCVLAHGLEERDGKPEVFFDARVLYNDGNVFDHRHELFRSFDGQIFSVKGPDYPYSECGVLLELDGEALSNHPDFSQLFERFLVARGELQAMLSGGENLTIIRNNNREVLDRQKNLEDNLIVAFRDRMVYEKERIRGMRFEDIQSIDRCFANVISLFMVAESVPENYSTQLCKEAGLPQLADGVREMVHSIRKARKAVLDRSDIDRIYMDAGRLGRKHEESLKLVDFVQSSVRETEEYYKSHSIDDDHLYKSFLKYRPGFSSESVGDDVRREWFREYVLAGKIIDFSIEQGFLRDTVFSALSSSLKYLDNNPLLKEGSGTRYGILDDFLNRGIIRNLTDSTYEHFQGDYLSLSGGSSEKPFVADIDGGVKLLVTGVYRGNNVFLADGISMQDGSELTGTVLPERCLYELNSYLVERASAIKESFLEVADEESVLENQSRKESDSEGEGVDWKVEDAVYGYLCSSGDEKSAAEFCSVLKDRGIPEEKVSDLLAQTEVYRQSLVKGKSEVIEQKRGKGIA